MNPDVFSEDSSKELNSGQLIGVGNKLIGTVFPVDERDQSDDFVYYVGESGGYTYEAVSMTDPVLQTIFGDDVSEVSGAALRYYDNGLLIDDDFFQSAAMVVITMHDSARDLEQTLTYEIGYRGTDSGVTAMGVARLIEDAEAEFSEASRPINSQDAKKIGELLAELQQIPDA